MLSDETRIIAVSLKCAKLFEIHHDLLYTKLDDIFNSVDHHDTARGFGCISCIPREHTFFWIVEGS